MGDLARAEKIGRAYISTMLRLTVLAPDILEIRPACWAALESTQ